MLWYDVVAVAIAWVLLYLYAPEDSMCVYAVLCAAAVHHGGAGVTVVACCMAANTEQEKSDDGDLFIQMRTAKWTVNLLESEKIDTVVQHFDTVLNSLLKAILAPSVDHYSIKHFQLQNIKIGKFSVPLNHFTITKCLHC